MKTLRLGWIRGDGLGQNLLERNRVYRYIRLRVCYRFKQKRREGGSVREAIELDFNVEKILRVMNGVQKAGIIQRYAIAGGVATLFYAEPISTIDLDLFVLLPKTQGYIADLTLFGNI